MFLPLLYIVIILQIRATTAAGLSLSCNETEYAEAGKDVIIKCNISAKAFQKCKVQNCTCEAKVCNHGKMSCNWTETELYLHLFNVIEDQDFNVSIKATCGNLISPVQLKVYRSAKQGDEETSPPERSHAANVAVGVFGIIGAVLLLVLLQLRYKKRKTSFFKQFTQEHNMTACVIG